jgi:uncharacterized repeat protein (TIGR01451 family)
MLRRVCLRTRSGALTRTYSLLLRGGTGDGPDRGQDASPLPRILGRRESHRVCSHPLAATVPRVNTPPMSNPPALAGNLLAGVVAVGVVGVVVFATSTRPVTLAGTAATPGLNIVKSADVDSIVYGDAMSFTITVWNAGPDELTDVVLDDTPPQPFGMGDLDPSIVWDFEFEHPDADDSCEWVVEGEVDILFVIHCAFGTLPVTDMTGGKVVIVTGQTSVDECGSTFGNTTYVDAGNDLEGPRENYSGDQVLVTGCPAFEVVADVGVITISDSAAVPTARPPIVTWTLRWTVAEGRPLNDVVIDSHPPPAGLVFLDASDGGSFDGDAVRWSFPTLSGSGSVTYRTLIDPATLDRDAPIETWARLGSADPNQYDSFFFFGEASIGILEASPVPSPAASDNPRPGSVPDTAASVGLTVEP